MILKLQKALRSEAQDGQNLFLLRKKLQAAGPYSSARHEAYQELAAVEVPDKTDIDYLIARIKKFPQHKATQAVLWPLLKKELLARNDLNLMEACRQRLETYANIQYDLAELMESTMKETFANLDKYKLGEEPAWLSDWLTYYDVKVPTFLEEKFFTCIKEF